MDKSNSVANKSLKPVNKHGVDRHKFFLDRARSDAKKSGCICLSDRYVDAFTHMKWRCKCGNIWGASYNNFVNNNTRCPICGVRKGANSRVIHSLDDCIKTAAERCGFCESKEYKNIKSIMFWRCHDGHKWGACYDSILGGKNRDGTWCPYCNKPSIGEAITRKFFEVGFDDKFVRCRPEWLVNKEGNRLELDGYNEKLKIAFEFNGIQHDKEISKFFHKRRSFSRGASNDAIKKRLCRKNGISFIVVRYDIPFENIAKFIYDECVKRSLNVDKKILSLDYRNFDIYNHGLDEERAIIESKGGVLLSDRYIDAKSKLDIVCGNGHKFSACSGSIKQGHWCPYCVGLGIPTLDHINEFVGSKGRCLSKKYIDSQTKMEFGCLCGNKFLMCWNHVQQGSWCPKCGVVRRSERRRLSLVHVNEFVKSKGTCLSKIYVSAQAKLKFYCKCGNKFLMSWNAVQQGSWCPVCSQKRRFETRYKRWGY